MHFFFHFPFHFDFGSMHAGRDCVCVHLCLCTDAIVRVPVDVWLCISALCILQPSASCMSMYCISAWAHASVVFCCSSTVPFRFFLMCTCLSFAHFVDGEKLIRLFFALLFCLFFALSFPPFVRWNTFNYVYRFGWCAWAIFLSFLSYINIDGNLR